MPIDPISAVGAGIGVLTSLGQTIGGLAGMKKTKEAADKAVSDIKTYTADPEIQKILQMRAARLGMGLGATTKAIAQQGIGSAAASATKGAQAMGKGAGLSTLGAIQRQAGKQYEGLALREEAAQEEQRRAYERAASAASAERARQFQSEQEKQQLQANIALEKVAAKRQGLQQGLQGLTAAGLSMIGSNMFYKKGAGGTTPSASIPTLGTPRSIPGASILTTDPTAYARSMGLYGRFSKPATPSSLLDRAYQFRYDNFNKK